MKNDPKLLKKEDLISFKKRDNDVKVGNQSINSSNFIVLAGPCCIENETQALETAFYLKNKGFTFMKGGIYKPRTSPYSFQGIGRQGISILKKIKEIYKLKICTELMDIKELEYIYDIVDLIQIGTRNMQNFNLLKELGKIKKPILLKRGFASTIKEWILSAEYILKGGNEDVILCERGIRSFDQHYTRNVLDLNSVLVIKKNTHLPIIVDPSHSSGDKDYVIGLSKAAYAIGADGILVDLHPYPEKALVDGFQSLNFEMFDNLCEQIAYMSSLFKRELI